MWRKGLKTLAAKQNKQGEYVEPITGTKLFTLLPQNLERQ